MHNTGYVFGRNQPAFERLVRRAEMVEPITQRRLVSAAWSKGCELSTSAAAQAM
jgi:hypothetical protein